MRNTLLLLTIIAILSCDSREPIIDLQYPNDFGKNLNFGIMPEGEIHGSVYKTEESSCSHFNNRNGKIIPVKSSCEVIEEITYNMAGNKILELYTGAVTKWEFNDSNILYRMTYSNERYGVTIQRSYDIRNGKIVGYSSKPLSGDDGNYNHFFERYNYDEKGYLISVISKLTTLARTDTSISNYELRYNNNGQLVKKIKKSDKVVEQVFEYDKNYNYLGYKEFENGSLKKDEITNHSYNKLGLLIESSDNGRDYFANYNDQGNLLSSSLYVDNKLERRIINTYNDSGILTSESFLPTYRLHGSALKETIFYDDFDIYGNWKLRYTKIGDNIMDVIVREIDYFFPSIN